MKRLIRQSNFDYNMFLSNLVFNNSYSQSDVQQVINDNSDCLYSGQGYRILYLDKDEIKDAFIEFMNENNEEKMDLRNHYFHYYALNVLDKVIKVNSKYQSFAKTFNGVMNFSEHMKPDMEPTDLEIIINCDLNNALDIYKLVEKYENELNKDNLEDINYFKNQEEILGIIDSNYGLSEFGSLQRIFEEFEKH